jgi:hypothetical protein
MKRKELAEHHQGEGRPSTSARREDLPWVVKRSARTMIAASSMLTEGGSHDQRL